MKKVQVSAPGKIHLLGEHAVVYGYPALLAAVNRRTTVSLSSESQVHDSYIAHCLHEGFSYFGEKVPEKFFLQIASDIPKGTGMGSSAAVAVAVAGLVVYHKLGKVDKEKINEIAFKSEVFMHGTPSGGDNTASCYGGLIWYQKRDRVQLKPISFAIPSQVQSHFFLINTGTPQQTTKEMVHFVKEQMKEKSTEFTSLFEQQSMLIEKLLFALESSNISLMKDIFQHAEETLEKIGVVSDQSKEIIRQIETNGGAAKICGAGARSGPTGMVLAFHEDTEKLKATCNKLHYTFELVSLGEEGVKIEN